MLRAMLGLPDTTRACLFDLDGVLTDTASVHAAAWKQMFDDYLRARAERTGTPFEPFDVKDDYGPYVDGKPRLDGTRGFLASRGITLPDGDPSDGPDAETVNGLATRRTSWSTRRSARSASTSTRAPCATCTPCATPASPPPSCRRRQRRAGAAGRRARPT